MLAVAAALLLCGAAWPPLHAGIHHPVAAPSTTAAAFIPNAFLQALVEGVKYGLIIAMMAIGLSLIYGTTGLINFAHGEVVTIGAAIALYFNKGPAHLQLLVAATIAVLLGAVVGGALEIGLWRPLRNRRTGLIQLLVVSLGLSIAVRHVLLIIMGGNIQTYQDYQVQAALQLGPIAITPRDLVVVGLSVLVLLSVGLVVQRTLVGKALRAVSNNRELAEASGIDVRRVILYVWIAGGALAALGGVLLGLVQAISWDMGFNVLLLIFAGVVLGGLGTAFGALVGALVIGIVTQMSALAFPPELESFWALLALIAILILRPQGLLGSTARVRLG